MVRFIKDLVSRNIDLHYDICDLISVAFSFPKLSIHICLYNNDHLDKFLLENIELALNVKWNKACDFRIRHIIQFLALEIYLQKSIDLIAIL